jgi:LysR family positive regulator for ilvC
VPDIRVLKQFLHLSESLHFGRSSEALHVSPSTLSRAIARLEESVGAPLFERDNRTVALTDAGRACRLFAQDTVGAWQTLKAEVRAKPGELTGRIRIYCSVTASYAVMATILSEFRQQYPGVEVLLKTGDATFGVDKTLDQEVDLAVAPKPDYFPGQLVFQPVTKTPLVFIAPVIDCPVKALVSKSPINWATVPLVLPEVGLSRKRVDAWFKKAGLTPKIQAEVAGHEAIVSMVGLGIGIGVIPELVLDQNPMAKNITALHDAPKLPDYNVGVVVLEKKLKDPVIRAFWDVTQAVSQVNTIRD